MKEARMKVKSKRLIYVALGVLVVAVLYALKNTSYFARAASFIAAVAVFWIADSLFKLKFRNRHYLILVFIGATGLLFSPLYSLYAYYDKTLHFFNPVLFCIIIFYLVNRIKNISFPTKLFLTFSITVCFLSLWELTEFFLDKLYDTKMQGVWLRDITGASKISLIMDRNDDTMIDLLLGVIGTTVFSVGKIVEFCFIKKNKKKKN
jgi:hypothetical protein